MNTNCQMCQREHDDRIAALKARLENAEVGGQKAMNYIVDLRSTIAAQAVMLAKKDAMLNSVHAQWIPTTDSDCAVLACIGEEIRATKPQAQRIHEALVKCYEAAKLQSKKYEGMTIPMLKSAVENVEKEAA